jgi:type IV fimbrial biogenesis protein FimT
MTRSSGFTLIELLVAVAVIAITVSQAVPMINAFVANNTLAAATSSVVSDLALARSEAVRRGVTITVCPSTSGTACTTSSWRDGRIVFLDNDGSGSVNSGDTIIKVTKSFSAPGVSISQSGFSSQSYVQYTGTGTSSIGSGSFSICMHGSLTQQVSMTATGRVSTATGSSCP